MIRVLDLFSAAAGGWSLGMHRAGYATMAACEAVDWRRALYAQNNPGVRIYDDVRTLTAARLLADFGYLPDAVVGSPPCQDISSANTSGEGVDGARSGLFFEAVRIIGECRELARQLGIRGPRWFALENSANLRTKGSDRVINALAGIGYACWPFVVGADDCGANHERKRSWLIGCDLEQIADTDGADAAGWHALGRWSGWPEGPDGVGADGRDEGQATHAYGIGSIGFGGRGLGFDLSVSPDPRDTPKDGRRSGLPWRHPGSAGRSEQPPCGDATDADCRISHGRPEQSGTEGQRGDLSSHGAADRDIGGADGAGPLSGRLGGLGAPADAAGERHDARSGDDQGQGREEYGHGSADVPAPGSTDPDHGRIGHGHVCKHGIRWPHPCDPCDDAAWAAREVPDATEERPEGLTGHPRRQREGEEPEHADVPARREMGLRPPDRGGADGPWPLWSLDDLASRLRLDDGLPARVAGTRVAVGGPRGTVASSLIVEAYGDAVIPQIPEAIGRAILRVEAALHASLSPTLAEIARLNQQVRG